MLEKDENEFGTGFGYPCIRQAGINKANSFTASHLLKPNYSIRRPNSSCTRCRPSNKSCRANRNIKYRCNSWQTPVKPHENSEDYIDMFHEIPRVSSFQVREKQRKKNPYSGVIERTASVRSPNNPERLWKTDRRRLSVSLSQNSFFGSMKKKANAAKKTNSDNSQVSQKRVQNLTAETAELLGVPLPSEENGVDASNNISLENAEDGGWQSPTQVFWVKSLCFESIRYFIQPNENRLALRLFGSKKAVLKEKKRCEMESPWIIHPYSTFRFIWDFMMLTLLIINLVVLPVAIAFFTDKYSSFWFMFNCVNDSIFITDIILNFRTGIAQQQMAVQVILEPKAIRHNYIRGWFTIDLLSSIPMDYIFLVANPENGGGPQIFNASRTLKMLRLTKFLSLVRLLRVSRLMRYATQWEEIFNLASAAIRILNLIFMMVLISHWNGCLMFLLPKLYEYPTDSWVTVDNLKNKPWTEQYSWSLFRAMSHMLCIGYGQEPPRTLMDLWLVMISMLSGATCYALFIGHATNMIQQFDSSRRQYTEKIKQVEEYMAHRRLPPELQVRVHEYYEYKYKGKMFDEDVILEELNDCLKEEILNYNCRELVNVVPFFQGADPLFVSGVVSKLKFEVFQPGDYVIMEGTLGTKMFFIQQGTVEVITSENVSVAQLVDGAYFGEICLLAKVKRTASIRAESYCNLYSLEVEDFTEVLDEFPLMRNKLEDVARERLTKLGRKTSILEHKARKHRKSFYHEITYPEDIKLSDPQQQQLVDEASEQAVRRLSIMLDYDSESPQPHCCHNCCHAHQKIKPQLCSADSPNKERVFDLHSLTEDSGTDQEAKC